MSSWKYLQTATLGTVTLDSGYTSGSGSMVLTAGEGARLPSTGDYWIAWSEDQNDPDAPIHLWKVTARSTDTLTVTAEATEGAGDTNVSAGETLRAIWSLAAMIQFRQDIHSTGADASKSVVATGDLWMPNNGYYIRRYNGSGWANWGPVFPLTEPVNGDFTDFGSPTVSTTNGGVTISVAAGTDLITGRQKSISGITTVTVSLLPRYITENFHSAGIFVNDGTKIIVLAYEARSGATNLISTDWDNSTTFNAENFRLEFGYPGNLWLKWNNNSGGNRVMSYSTNGQDFEDLFSEGNTTFCTPTNIGMFVHRNNGTRGTLATFTHWVQT